MDLSISFLDHPDLVHILDENETMLSLLQLNAEEILLKWANSILKQFDFSSFVPLNNLGFDLRDGQALSVLLHSINKNLPLPCSKTNNMVLQHAEAMGIKTGITPQQLSMLDSKMGAMLVSQIFSVRHGDRSIVVCDEADMNFSSPIHIPSSYNAHDTDDQTDCFDGDEMDTRTEATLKNWIHSQNFSNLHMDNLFDDDMVSLLRLLDHVEPGLVTWKKVFLPPVNNRFQKMDNAHYVVALCEKMGLKVINIAGLDLIDGQKKMILAIVSQLMRRHASKGLVDLAKHKGLTKVTNDHIVEWVNRRVSSYDINRCFAYPSQYVTNFATQPLVSLNDPRLRDGFIYLLLIDAVSAIANLNIDEPIDRQLVIHYPDTKTTSLSDKHHDTHVTDENEHGENHENMINHINEAAVSISYTNCTLTDSQRMSNTCLALNLAKQIGAQVYMTGEDLLRGGKKIIVAFLSAVWDAELRHLKNLRDNEDRCGEVESFAPMAVYGIDNTTATTAIFHSVASSNNVSRVIQTSAVRSIR